MMFGACANEEAFRAAGAAAGVSRADISLPELPGECRKQYGLAPLKAGDEARIAIARSDAIIRAANLTIGNCAAFYDDVKAGFSRTP